MCNICIDSILNLLNRRKEQSMSIKIAREGLSEAESKLKDEKIKGMLYELEAEIDEGDIDIRVVEFPGAIRTELSFTLSTSSPAFLAFVSFIPVVAAVMLNTLITLLP